MGKNLMKQRERRKRLEEARTEARSVALNSCEDLLTKADITMLYTLNKEFGIGPIRARRFYMSFINNQYEMMKQFKMGEHDEETHYLVMADRLKRRGIDVEALQAEGEAIKKPEYDYEQRQRLIKEMLNGNT